MFVSQAAFNRISALLYDAERRAEQERRRFDALLEKYHALKLAGAGESAPATKPLQRSAPDPVAEVIADRAGPNPRLRTQLTLFAASERRNGVPDLEIAKQILHWQDDTSGVPE